jgi:hypothetical protein
MHNIVYTQIMDIMLRWLLLLKIRICYRPHYDGKHILCFAIYRNVAVLETAKKYTRQVRQYIDEQQMKCEREKYRQKKLTQQRKTLLNKERTIL